MYVPDSLLTHVEDRRYLLVTLVRVRVELGRKGGLDVDFWQAAWQSYHGR